MPRSGQDAVPAFPLRFIPMPILAKVIDFVFSDRLYSTVFPRDIDSAVKMSLLYVFCVSFSESSVGETSHAPVPASLPRAGFVFVCLFCFLFAWFPVRCCPHCLREPHRAVRGLYYYPPVRFSITFSYIRNSPCLRRG